jgi:ribonuclease BN (tRNA processing enzyme)
MASVRVQFVGTGDAFGSGGGLQACISVRAPHVHVLLDCGATTLVGLRQQGIDPGSVDAVILSHLHGDHFGGIPFLVLDGQFRRREKPLLVAGPPGTAERVVQAMEVFFPGSSQVQRRFELHLVELAERTTTYPPRLPVSVRTVPVIHASGSPAYGLRVELANVVIGYSGDTEWSDALIEVAAGSDLFACEAYSYERRIRFHLGYATLREHLPQLGCRKVVLTHLGPDMLAHQADISPKLLVAHDGLAIDL